MKKLILPLILILSSVTSYGIVIGVDAGINITNNGAVLKPYVPQITPNNPNNYWDWLAEDGPTGFTNYENGQVSQYNVIETASLPQPPGAPGATPPGTYLQDDNGSNNGSYKFAAGSYYITGHWGQASAAFYLTVTDPNQMYSMATQVHLLEGQPLNSTDDEAFKGHLSVFTPFDPDKPNKPWGWKHTGGGYSNMRAWQVSKRDVPDTGSTLILLGLGLGVLGFLRRRK